MVIFLITCLQLIVVRYPDLYAHNIIKKNVYEISTLNSLDILYYYLIKKF